MPYDPESADDDESPVAESRARRFTEFECPECSANNPLDDGFGHGDEVICNYCGQELKAQVSDEGKLKLKPA